MSYKSFSMEHASIDSLCQIMMCASSEQIWKIGLQEELSFVWQLLLNFLDMIHLEFFVKSCVLRIEKKYVEKIEKKVNASKFKHVAKSKVSFEKYQVKVFIRKMKKNTTEEKYRSKCEIEYFIVCKSVHQMSSAN